MSEKENTTTELNKDSASFDPSPSPEFLREKIKQKPINKKKLLRRTLFTVFAAAVFGLVACVTFLLLEPLISSKITHNTSTPVEPEESTVVLDIEDEINPEDMYATDTEMIEEALQGNVADVSKDIQTIENMISDIKFGVEDYRTVYKELNALAETVCNSVVTVTGYTEETDVLSNNFSNNSVVSGLIVADNGRSLLILAKNEELFAANKIILTFCNSDMAEGTIQCFDDITKYMIISVDRSALKAETLDIAKPAKIGTSRSSTLKGSPIMALGSPTGITNSISYGVVTSDTQPINIVDADYMIINTDIDCASNASGIIVNFRGYVLGIIDTEYSPTPGDNMLHALGITELKPLIEKLSNKESKAYLGVTGTDITVDMAKMYNIPEGIYFSNVDIDSPAMYAGLQSGDILTAVNGKAPNSYHDFINWLYSCEPGEEVRLTISRQSVDNYISLTLTATLGQIDYEIVQTEE